MISLKVCNTIDFIDKLSVDRKEGITLANSKEAEEPKKEILDVAEELFIAKGYDNTSTTDILERVGIARGTLYYHFKSKERRRQDLYLIWKDC